MPGAVSISQPPRLQKRTGNLKIGQRTMEILFLHCLEGADIQIPGKKKQFVRPLGKARRENQCETDSPLCATFGMKFQNVSSHRHRAASGRYWSARYNDCFLSPCSRQGAERQQWQIDTMQTHGEPLSHSRAGDCIICVDKLERKKKKNASQVRQ